jgi:hypothetical protein
VIVRGVLVPAPLCARCGPLLDLLVRAHARQNGVPVDAELDGLLRELVTVGLAYGAGASVPASVSGRAAETPSESPAMDTGAAAGLLSVTPHRVRQRARAGEFGRKAGGRWVFDRDEIKETS